MKKHWFIGLVGCLFLSGVSAEASIKTFSFDNKTLTLESVSVEEEKLIIVVDGFSNVVSFQAGGIQLPAHAYAVADGKELFLNEIQMDSNEDGLTMTFKMDYSELPDEVYLYKDTQENSMLIWSKEESDTEAPETTETKENSDAQADIYSELAGSWSGIGTSLDGIGDISLSVEINEDGSGTYLFEQSGYKESYPFTLNAEGENFHVNIPKENQLNISSCGGTYHLNDDNSLHLEITTMFENSNRYFQYSAELQRVQEDGQTETEAESIEETEIESETETEEKASSAKNSGKDRAQKTWMPLSSAQDFPNEVGEVNMVDGTPLYVPETPGPLNAYLVTREDCEVGINHDNMYSVSEKGLHEAISTPVKDIARLIEQESLNTIRFVEDPQDADILVSVSQRFNYYGDYSGAGLYCKVYSSTVYVTAYQLTDTNHKAEVQKSHTPGNTVTTSGGSIVWMNPPEFDDSEEIKTLVNTILGWYGFNAEIGSNSDGVRWAQQMLIDRGYLEGTADGKFGQKTEEAVKKLQTDYQLEESGKIDEPTLIALYYNQFEVDQILERM